MEKMAANHPVISDRAYAILLRAYPRGFRAEYGRHMTQLFRDCYRAARLQDGFSGLMRLWFNILLDVFNSAPKERFDTLRKEDSFMTNLRRDVVAVLGCLAIVVFAFLLLSYGRKHEVASILIFGYILDAVVTTGLVGNLIVFILAKATSLNHLRTAFWTFLIVNAVPAVLIAAIAGRTDPQFRLVPTIVGYVVSFLFWFGLHWVWSKTAGQLSGDTRAYD